MNYIGSIVLLGSIHLSAYASPIPSCATQQIPQILRSIDNWDVIAGNIIPIQTAPYFSGPGLTYTVIQKPMNGENRVTIDENTGELTINAARKDNFNVSVTAKNACGAASITFNVQIDEEH